MINWFVSSHIDRKEKNFLKRLVDAIEEYRKSEESRTDKKYLSLMRGIELEEQREIVCREHPIYSGRCDSPNSAAEELYCTSVENYENCTQLKLIQGGKE